MLRDNLDKIGQVRPLRPYTPKCAVWHLQKRIVVANVPTRWHCLQSSCAAAGYEGEATAAHDNITDAADEDASCCIPVSCANCAARVISGGAVSTNASITNATPGCIYK